MKNCQDRSAPIACPQCDIGPFKRNHYFTGKLLVERDFTDEQRYFIDKLRHHHQRLHGKGVVCGLRITQHEQEACRDRYLCLEPGTAIDCCGKEIMVHEAECIDITRHPKVKALFDEADASGNGEMGEHTLRICIRHRECPTEEIPVLYDECGCDETRCAPNRILESWELDVLLDDEFEAEEPEDDDTECCERFHHSLRGCPSCETGDCIILATIEGYRPGFKFMDLPAGDGDLENQIARIDNLKDRLLLPSTQMLAEVVKCLCERAPGGDAGESGHGIDKVDVTFLDCTEDGPATGTWSYEKDGDSWVLKLGIPKACDGKDGEDGSPGLCLEEDLTQITLLSWIHGQKNARFAEAKIVRADGTESKRPAVVIAFSNKVHIKGVDAEHVFQVLLRHEVRVDGIPLLCRCAMPGAVIPVKVTKRIEIDDESVITEVEKVEDDSADALAFIWNAEYSEHLKRASELWVVLRGNFVLDAHDRAIDAEFVCGKVPSGVRLRTDGSNHGVQGGVFESWFSVQPEPQ